MSHYLMYRCDRCGFEDDDPFFLVADDDDGDELCADCDKRRQRPAGGREDG